ETVPGDPATLPAGATPNQADLDFTGTLMPPPGSGVPALSEDEKRTIARWIDLGSPINSGEETGDGAYGWFLDDLRPTLTVSLPRSGSNPDPVDQVRFGLADNYSGIDLATLSVTASFAVAGRPADAELADLALEVGDGIRAITLASPIPELPAATVRVEVADFQGNVTRVEVAFDTLPIGIFADGFESGDTGSWSSSIGG
ncbi:MAG: hypothetical protein GY953_32020, partial [bacterium]|nr:hypothetical protein [bacterium]